MSDTPNQTPGASAAPEAIEALKGLLSSETEDIKLRAAQAILAYSR